MAGVNFPSDPSIQRTPSGDNSASKRIERIETGLTNLAEHLPSELPASLPFSGRIAFQVGDGPFIEASHFPGQEDCPEACPSNCLSVGKEFTAIPLMQWIQNEMVINGKKITLDTPLSDLLTPEEMDLELNEPYLQGKPSPEDIKKLQANAHKITVGDLLSHHSGLTTIEGEDRERFFEVLPKDIKHPYSNYGFQLLAHIIGKHSPWRDKSNTDKSAYLEGFKKHVEQEIFVKAEMVGAIVEYRDRYKGGDPVRSEVEDDGIRVELAPFSLESPEPYPHGNGCWRMHPKDLLCFAKALRHNTLIREETFRSMLERKPPLCFMVDRDKDDKVIGYGHPGKGAGLSSFMHTWLTDPPITAVVLSNYSNGSNIKPFLDEKLPSLLD